MYMNPINIHVLFHSSFLYKLAGELQIFSEFNRVSQKNGQLSSIWFVDLLYGTRKKTTPNIIMFMKIRRKPNNDIFTIWTLQCKKMMFTSFYMY